MKVLFVGLGSAGQRHLRNLLAIYNNNVEILAYRVKHLSRVFNDDLKIIPGKILEEVYPIREFSNFSEAIAQNPDVVFITNPNSMHIEFALAAVKKGIDVFIEKPLSNTIKGIEELKIIAYNKKVLVYTGFQMRFHPCILKAKEILDAGKIGTIVYVNCEIGELLTKMHPYEDYRRMIEAQKSMGGGVVQSQIHELDYISYLLGLPKDVYSIGGLYSDMEIDVEDSATSILRYQEKNGVYPVIIHQDFLQNPPVRQCKFVGTYGSFEMDLLNNEIVFTNEHGSKERFFYPQFKRNDMFIAELKYFLYCKFNRKLDGLSIEEASKSLKLALAIKESMQTNEHIQIN